jgi:cytochrome c peroxidase
MGLEASRFAAKLIDSGRNVERNHNMTTMGRTRLTFIFALVLQGWVLDDARGQVPPPPPPELPPVPVPPQNPITEPKRLLGKVLFWDEQLSSDNSIACGTCHVPARAGADPRVARNPGLDLVFNTPDDVLASPGVRRADVLGEYYSDAIFGFAPQAGSRTAQHVLGALWSPQAFWDGRAGPQFVNPETGVTTIPNGGALESQALGPILNEVEMAHEERNWPEVTAKLASSQPLVMAINLPADLADSLAGDPTYPDLFAAAFGDPAITAERIAFAIATYERTLVPNQTPWDAFVGGNPNAMTQNQVAGWDFFRNNQCAVCHAPPMFTNNTFRNVGLRPVAEDTGRQQVTGDPNDRGRFKVPSLRNTGLKNRFMHTGQLATLGQVLDFYQPANGQIQFADNRDPLIPPINIPPQVRPQLIDFLANGLTDPRVASEQFPFDRPRLHSEVLGDYAVLEDCMTGPGQPPSPAAPTTPQQCLTRFDRDADGDIDVADYAAFQTVYSAN